MDAHKIKLLLTIIIISIISLTGCLDSFESIKIKIDENEHSNADVDTEKDISIACWNLQIFGLSKARNESLLSYYHSKLSTFDIFIIQEIRDASGTAIETFAELFHNHTHIISKRAGKTSSKEQYAIFYNEKLTLLDYDDFTDEYQAEINRPPLQATFKCNNLTFTIFTIHTDPDDVYNELSTFEEITSTSSIDSIIMGDLNADGTYYDESNKNHFLNWYWILPDYIDTTVASSDNTYDRIIINEKMKNNIISYGVMDNVTQSQSDHYMIYATINTEEP